MKRIGTQADLARELGISASAVSQAFRRHNIQLTIEGKFDLDYATWLLKEKQNQRKSQGQRAANKKQPAGLKNPKVKREIIRLLWPIWDEAITATLRSRAETSFEDETDKADLEQYLFACMGLWAEFHKLIDREIPPDPGDFDFKKPDCIDFDFMRIPMLEQIEKILKRYPGDNAEQSGKTDYSQMPLDELERLVLNEPDPDL